MTLNIDGRRFVPVENSTGGTVSSATLFSFAQTDDRLTADYKGGDVTQGHIIGHICETGSAIMLYHCRKTDGTLAAGHAKAQFDMEPSGQMTIAMDWRWLTGSVGSGRSFYREVTP